MGKKKSGAEAMPQWSDENNTMEEHLSAIRERMPLLVEYNITEYIEE